MASLKLSHQPTMIDKASTLRASKNKTTSQQSRTQDAVKRDAVRSKIDIACQMINKLIADNGSRRACRGLVDKLDSMYAETKRLNLLAVTPIDAEEFGRQAVIQIALFTQMETAKEDVDGFIILVQTMLLLLLLFNLFLSEAKYCEI